MFVVTVDGGTIMKRTAGAQREKEIPLVYHAARGELLRRIGRRDAAAAADRRARELTVNPTELQLLHERIGPPPTDARAREAPRRQTGSGRSSGPT